MKKLSPNTVRVILRPYGITIEAPLNAQRWGNDNIVLRLFNGMPVRHICQDWARMLMPRGKFKPGLYVVKLVRIRRQRA